MDDMQIIRAALMHAAETRPRVGDQTDYFGAFQRTLEGGDYKAFPAYKSGAKPVPSGNCSAEDPRNLWRLMELRDQIDAGLVECVAAARAMGWSWSRIAGQIGGTKQAAQQRYGKKPTGPAPDRETTLPGL